MRTDLLMPPGVEAGHPAVRAVARILDPAEVAEDRFLILPRPEAADPDAWVLAQQPAHARS